MECLTFLEVGEATPHGMFDFLGGRERLHHTGCLTFLEVGRGYTTWDV